MSTKLADTRAYGINTKIESAGLIFVTMASSPIYAIIMEHVDTEDTTIDGSSSEEIFMDLNIPIEPIKQAMPIKQAVVARAPIGRVAPVGRGFVYFATRQPYDGTARIGVTKHPRRLLADLKQRARERDEDDNLRIYATVMSEHYVAREKAISARLSRVNRTKWYKIKKGALDALIAAESTR